MRIDQHPVFGVESLTDVDHRQVLIGPACAVEVAVAPRVGGPDAVHLQDTGGNGFERVAAGQRREHAVGVCVLLVDPGPGLRRVLIFEPSIGVRHVDAMDGVDARLDSGVRRCWHGFSWGLARARHANEDDGDGDRGDGGGRPGAIE